MKIITSAEKYDIIIIGSGPAGSLHAQRASRAGKRVLVLEAGPQRTLDDLVSSQINARRLKWPAEPVEEEGNLKVGNNFNSGWGTGGSAMHHYAVWPRLHANDFNVNSDYGVGLDWPIDYQDLRPHYDKIQLEVGISGDTVAEKWRPPAAPYPQPAMPVFAQGQVIAKGFKALNKHVAPIPLAINSTTFDNRPACLFDGWCDAGCPTGALFNPLVKYLPEMLKNNGEIRHNAQVVKLNCNHDGQRVESVDYVDTQDGSKTRVHADVVILAAFAIQNPRLLLASANAHHPNGLANSSGLVGHYLMTHPARSIYGLFDAETTPHLGATGGQLICHDGYLNKNGHKDSFGSYQWLIANALKPNDLLGFANTRPDIIGADLQPFMQKASSHMGTMVYVGEDIAQTQNRVVLSSNRDRFGTPLAKATHNTGIKTDKLSAHALAEGLSIFKAAGAASPWSGPAFGMHMMGGTIMGSKRSNSVCNAYGQSHDLSNLFIAGTGLFPSSGAVNPTFTLHALADMSADYLLKNWSVIAQ